jgi:uncharacterized protein YciI
MRRLFVLLFLLSVTALAQPVPARQYLLRLEPVRKDFSLQNLTEDERRIVMEHAAFLKRMQSEGKLVFAGQAFDPNRGFWGILVVNANDPKLAAELMNADPAIQQKLVRGEVIPFRTVIMGPAADSAGPK